jgi:hypothetical protein
MDELIPERQASLTDAESSPRRRRLPVGNAEERELVAAYLGDWAPIELGDEAPLASSVTRALGLFTAAGVPPARWPDLLYRARAITKERSAQIAKRPAAGGPGRAAKNRMPYFLAVLADLCGLKEQSAEPTGARRAAEADGTGGGMPLEPLSSPQTPRTGETREEGRLRRQRRP